MCDTNKAGFEWLSHDAGSGAAPPGEATSTQSRSGRGSDRPPSSSGVGALRFLAPRIVRVRVPFRPMYMPTLLPRRLLVGDGVDGDGGIMAGMMYGWIDGGWVVLCCVQGALGCVLVAVG